MVARMVEEQLGMQARPGIGPHIWHILSRRFGPGNIFMTILPLPLIQEEQLSVYDERMYTNLLEVNNLPEQCG